MTPPILDHLVHLVQPDELEHAIAAFSELGFQVLRGGTHADGLTSNTLIVLPDGIYIELISFTDKPVSGVDENWAALEKRRTEHWWWGRLPGWIDWALEGGGSDGRAERTNLEAAAQGASIRYDEPQNGGRRTHDGNDIRWKVTFPSSATGKRSTVPFWCEDLTPRELRVPQLRSPHPNGCTGCASITLLYDPSTYLSATANLRLILSQPATTAPGTSARSDGVDLLLATPHGSFVTVHVRIADDPAEREWINRHGEGLYEVVLRVSADKLPETAPPDGVERSTAEQGWGRLRLHPSPV